MKIVKRRWLIYLIACTAKYCLKFLLRTCRFQVEGLENFLIQANKSSCILMLWHNKLIPLAEILTKYAPQLTYHAVVSKSRDGDLLAFFADTYRNCKVIRVAHNARYKALNQMVATLREKRTVLLVTPDGPRGPKFQAKPGVAMAAKAASVPTIPFSWQAQKAWKLQTWDNMLIPKPFSKIKVIFGQALVVNTESSVSQESINLQTVLMDLEKDFLVVNKRNKL